MADKPKLTLGKQLMKFIADEDLIRVHVDFQTDTGHPLPRYEWSPDGEARLNEFLREREELIQKFREAIRQYCSDYPCCETPLEYDADSELCATCSLMPLCRARKESDKED